MLRNTRRSMCGNSGDFRSRRIHKRRTADWTATGLRSLAWNRVATAANAYEQATEWHKKRPSWQEPRRDGRIRPSTTLARSDARRGGREKNMNTKLLMRLSALFMADWASRLVPPAGDRHALEAAGISCRSILQLRELCI